MLGIMNDYEALFSKAPPIGRGAHLPLVETNTARKRPQLLADHRYQLGFLLDEASTAGNASCFPIGRNQAASTAPKEGGAVGTLLNDDISQISPIFTVNNNFLLNNVNFFDYETTCEPISPIKINNHQNNAYFTQNQNQDAVFNFTPNFQPLYTNHVSTLHQSRSSSSLNSIDSSINSPPLPPKAPIFDSDSSNPVWQDRFLNINELLLPLPPPIDYDDFDQSLFTLDRLLDDDQHHVTPFDRQGHVVSSDEGGPTPTNVAGGKQDEGSLLSSFYNTNNRYNVEILTNQETTAASFNDEEAELMMEKVAPVIGHVIFGQSAHEPLKNQQEIFDEIVRECEHRVSRSRDSSVSDPNTDQDPIDQSELSPFINQPIINLELDDFQSITPPPAPPSAPPVSSNSSSRKRSRDPNWDSSPTTLTNKKKSLNSASLLLSIDDDSDESFEFSSNLDDFDDLEIKKKSQNRRAASKYRTKRKIERINIESERNRLEEENQKLKSIVNDRQREIDYLKKFLNEIRASRQAKNVR